MSDFTIQSVSKASFPNLIGAFRLFAIAYEFFDQVPRLCRDACLLVCQSCISRELMRVQRALYAA